MIFCCGDRAVIHISNSAEIRKGGSDQLVLFVQGWVSAVQPASHGLETACWKGLIFLFLIKPATAA